MPSSSHRHHRSVAATLVILALIAASQTEPANAEPGVGAKVPHRKRPPLQAKGLDPRQLVKVRAAQRLADRRLETRTECSTLFDDLDQTGPAALNAMVVDLNADPSVCQRGVAATTQVHGNSVSLCRQWLPRLDRHQLAMLLIHEALHHAGLGEAPTDPEAPTSRAINRMVSKRCGL